MKFGSTLIKNNSNELGVFSLFSAFLAINNTIGSISCDGTVLISGDKDCNP